MTFTCFLKSGLCVYRSILKPKLKPNVFVKWGIWTWEYEQQSKTNILFLESLSVRKDLSLNNMNTRYFYNFSNIRHKSLGVKLEFAEGGKPEYPGEKPSESDWDRQISAHVRTRSRIVEVGGATDVHYANLTPKTTNCANLNVIPFLRLWYRVLV